MIYFYKKSPVVFAVDSPSALDKPDLEKLAWLFGWAEYFGSDALQGKFIGPRKEMVSPWSTNAVEITQNMGISGIVRIEEFTDVQQASGEFDPIIQHLYENLDQELFTVSIEPEPIISIDDIAAYNQSEGLALSSEEIEYLEELSVKLGRKLTD